MTPEESIQFHEQWLRSIESNLDRLSAAQADTNETMAASSRRMGQIEDALAVVAQNQSSFSAALASVTQRLETVATEQVGLAAQMRALAEDHRLLAEQHRGLAEQHRRLEEAFEQYLRFRSNGGQHN